MDEKIFDIIKREEAKQKEYINLIASENYVSEDVLKALGVFSRTNMLKDIPDEGIILGVNM